jgi:hypothetical protein
MSENQNKILFTVAIQIDSTLKALISTDGHKSASGSHESILQSQGR